MSKQTLKQKKLLEKKKQDEIKRRFYKRNWEAMRFCNKHGLTVYAAAQASNSNFVRLFRQKGVPFKPLSDKLYNQSEPRDVMEYVAAIDAEYERLYLKMKDRV